MDELKKAELLQQAWDMHAEIETAYLANSAIKTKDNHAWLEKQRFLLADMAIHLLHTALKPGDMELNLLRNNLHAILTISDQFLPKAELKMATRKIYDREN